MVRWSEAKTIVYIPIGAHTDWSPITCCTQATLQHHSRKIALRSHANKNRRKEWGGGKERKS